MEIFDQLGKRMLFFDGAMGTILQENGLGAGELPELWNLQKPELIQQIHHSYLKAGADIIKTNTFGANAVKLRGCGHSVQEIIGSAVCAAKKAVQANGGTGLIALDIGPTGKLLRPLGDLPFEDAYAAFREAAVCGEHAGADLILIETMSDTYEAKAALLAAKENTSLPVFVTLIFDEQGKLLTGGNIAAATATLEGLGADAIGFNCGLGPEQIKELLPQLKSCCSIPMIVNPNAGLPRCVDGKTVFDVSPKAFATSMAELASMGAWMVGGCCGTTPAHIAATVRACKEIPPTPLESHALTVVSSYSQAVPFGARPILIGERINPTGKSRFKQALRENDMDYILREGIAQQQSGAHILDVNVGLPEINETEMMCRAVTELQSIIDLPLQIDTASAETMEQAMRIYNGKPLINSVNGKQESMHAIFPLVKKYGGVVIALTLDEDGIPETAEGRLAVAQKIVDTAASYGIKKKDIIVDVLAMTISAGQGAAAVTLDSLRLVREQLGLYTSLGVSNISFGLPQRENINAAFFTMALQNGLSAAIINPNSQAMRKSYDAYCALSGCDTQCMDYIARYSQQTAETAPVAAAQMSVSQAIISGLKESAYSAAQELLRTKEPLLIISEELIPALDQVGKDFEKGILFLPQLLMSAEAAKAAFEVIRAQMDASGSESQVKKDKIVLATVKGDIHDIGKNIVKVLLENYSYDIIDLGKDVPPEKVVDAVKEHHVKLVGLSALMTTTVVSMEETIRMLRQETPFCKVMVGGAVLTQEYADMIHADRYVKDAMDSVRYAHELFGE
ncbi:homocysteine S-methyltransferase family protein [Anaeromassilibacillus senegalensis]|uniref:homocysteine S-methyltransferase family protein n=1 Tax=Anaeromassilibacillus senegalensis TaxID=1673717 RepID=UPI000681AFBC|nr:homocysteine S-methyltransferase family protein [Anaeromassilibacillus senegalensis]